MQESPLNEAQEMELASELLEITNEAELDHFLGKLISSVSRGIRNFAGSSLGRTLGGILKPLAKKFLPIATGALGTFIGGPLGGVAASQLGNLASRAFGLELEGMSAEDAQFEVARRFVRFASSAASNATSAPPTADPGTTARVAVTQAAQRHAPGLVRGGVLPVGVPLPTYPIEPGFTPPATQAPYTGHHARRKGVWIRRGRRILLLGV